MFGRKKPNRLAVILITAILVSQFNVTSYGAETGSSGDSDASVSGPVIHFTVPPRPAESEPDEPAYPVATPTPIFTPAFPVYPTNIPAQGPVVIPTPVPTSNPTPATDPAVKPTAAPTQAPGAVPTLAPTQAPGAAPTLMPTQTPTAVPTASPTASPTEKPVVKPTPTPNPSKTLSSNKAKELTNKEEELKSMGMPETVRNFVLSKYEDKLSSENVKKNLLGMMEKSSDTDKVKIKSIKFKEEEEEEKDEITVELGEELQIEIIIKPDNATEELIWESDDEDIVTVDEEGMAKGVGLGETTLTVRTESGIYAECTVKCVRKGSVPAEEVLKEEVISENRTSEIREQNKSQLNKVSSNKASSRGVSSNGASSNGVSSNGVSSNGVSSNGVSSNGVSSNGVSSNGVSSNGVSSNGVSSNGVSSNSVSDNGVSSNEVSLNSISFNSVSDNLAADAAAGDTTWQNDYDYEKPVGPEYIILKKFTNGSATTAAPEATATIDGITYKTKMAANCTSFFDGKTKLLTIDLSNVDSSGVTNMCKMFRDCTNVTSINLKNFDTSQVTDMGYLFEHCDNLLSIDVTGFNTSNVRDMQHMFCRNGKLRHLDLSNFDCTNVTTTTSMFLFLDSLERIDSPKNLKNTSDLGFYNGNYTRTDTGESVKGLPANLPYSVTLVLTYVSVNGISISPSEKTIDIDESFTVTATIEPSNATIQDLYWSSSDNAIAFVTEEGVATVSASEVVTGISAGGPIAITVRTRDWNRSDIPPRTSGYTATCMVTVKPRGVESVSLNKTTLSMNKGEFETLVATVLPTDAAEKSVSWNSSNPSVATVDENGKVTAVGTGDAVITVTTVDGGKTATCNVTVNPTHVTSVSLNKTILSMNRKDTDTLTATVNPEDADNKKVTWSSSDDSVVTVDQNGNITAVGVGEAVITVTTEDGGKTATCDVTVNPIRVISVSLDKISLSMNRKDTDTLTATVNPEDADDTSVSWNSSDPSVATVDQSGNIKAIGVGEATITVTTVDGGKTATCDVTVYPIRVISVSLNMSSVSMNVEETVSLNETVDPEDADDKSVSWNSSDPSVATVDDRGVITGITVGSAVITVITNDGHKTASCNVTVNPIYVTSVSLNEIELTKYEDETYDLIATVHPENATNKKVFWSSDDSGTVSVDQYGRIRTIAEGKTKVRVTTEDGNHEAVCEITVKKRPVEVESITVTPSENTIYIGQDFNLIATVSPNNATDKRVSWVSNNPAIAIVSGNGLSANVIGKAVGTAYITVTTVDGDKTATCVVTVIPVPKPEYVEDVYVDQMRKTIYVGESFDIIAHVVPYYADDTTVTWSSGNDKIATVSEGRVTGLKKGEVTITVTTNGTTIDGKHKSAECIVTVKEEPKPVPETYKLYIVDQRSDAYRSDKVRSAVESLAGDRYLVIRDSNGAEIKPLIKGDSSLSYTRALFYDMWITDVNGYPKDDFVRCTVRIPIPKEMNIYKGTVRVVTMLGGRLDKTIASSIGEEDGVYYVSFTTTHFTEYAILYKENPAQEPTVVYRDVPVIQYRTETRTVYTQPAAAQTIPLVNTRVLDGVPRTGDRIGIRERIARYFDPEQCMEDTGSGHEKRWRSYFVEP